MEHLKHVGGSPTEPIYKVGDNDHQLKISVSGKVTVLGGTQAQPPEETESYWAIFSLTGEEIAWCHTRSRAEALAKDFQSLGVAVQLERKEGSRAHKPRVSERGVEQAPSDPLSGTH